MKSLGYVILFTTLALIIVHFLRGGTVETTTVAVIGGIFILIAKLDEIKKELKK